MGQFSVEKPGLPGSVLSGNQHPDDEYDAYADKAYAMLMDERASGASIAAYLFNVATEHMRLSDRPGLAERSDHVAHILVGMRTEFETR